MSASVANETVRFRIPGNPRYVTAVRRAMRSIAANLGCSAGMAEDIEVCVAEALTNAVKHGSPAQGKSVVVITCRIEADKLTIDVRDEGPGFDAPNQTTPCGPLKEHGRGLTLIYQLMDNVEVCRTARGSLIRMVKRRTPRREKRATGTHV